MKTYEKVKIAVIGAGSVSFCPCTINDIVLSDKLCSLPLEIFLMDIRSEALIPAEAYAVAAAKHLGRDIEGYYNAVSAINEMFELQKEILPPLKW